MLLDTHTVLSDRITYNAVLAHHPTEVLNVLPVKRLATYWPTRGGLDALTVLDHWLAADVTHHALLPVVIDKLSPSQFRRWMSDCEMTPGVYNIPIPRSGEMKAPDTLLVPCAGLDVQRHRIGYGDGFYDHILAVLHAAGHRLHAAGVMYKMNRVESITP